MYRPGRDRAPGLVHPQERGGGPGGRVHVPDVQPDPRQDRGPQAGEAARRGALLSQV